MLKMTIPHSQISLLVKIRFAALISKTLHLNGLPQQKFYSLESPNGELVGRDGGSTQSSREALLALACQF